MTKWLAGLGVATSTIAALVVGCGENIAPIAEPAADGGQPAASQFVVGGTVTGLLGGGLVLQNSGSDDLAVDADGSFAFATKIAGGTAFDVGVKTQPSAPTQKCTVAGGAGVVISGDVRSVAVTCTTSSYKVRVNVTGLAGSGLVLQNNAADDLPIAADGTFEFATPVSSGGAYAVTVLTSPSNRYQTCAVTGGAGVMAGADVTASVVCSNDLYAVGGNVVGLGAGESVVLQNNGTGDTTVGANGAFTLGAGVPSGDTYAVTVLTSPPGKSCTVANGSGTITNAAIANVNIVCAALVGTVAGVSFYAIDVVGTMTDANILAACQAAGLMAPCQGPAGCSYRDANCKDVSAADASCGNPMFTLSQSLCSGSSPSSCPALYGKYYYMGEHWSGGCGAEAGSWCTTGNSISNKQALCVTP